MTKMNKNAQFHSQCSHMYKSPNVYIENNTRKTSFTLGLYTNREIKILKHLQNKIRRGPWLEPTPVQVWVCPWWSYEDHIFTKGDSLLKFSSESADDSSDEFGSLL